MIFISTLLLLGFVIFIAILFANHMIFGPIISDRDLLDYLIENKDNTKYGTIYPKQVTIGTLHIRRLPVTIFTKFYIANAYVQVSIFSKSHKILNEIYKNRPREKKPNLLHILTRK